jgi:peroxiredoxin
MNRLIYILLLFIFGIATTDSIGQNEAFNLNIKVSGIKDSIIYLANYYGDKQYLKDSTNADASGKFSFKSQEPMPGGIYLIVLPGKRYFEVVVDKEQKFSMETEDAQLVEKMKVSGSEQNKMFYEYLRFIQQKQKEVEPLRQAFESTKENPDSSVFYREKINIIDKEVKEYKENFIKKNPGWLMSKLFKASTDPVIPDPPILESGEVDSLFSFKYYKAHYLDNLDFSDDRLLRTPVFHNRLQYYLKNLTLQIPDSINKEADFIITKAKANKDVFRYVVNYITYTYETSNIMGMDAVFVHMAKNYYTPDQAFWVDSIQLYKIKDKAATLEPLLLGKKAQNLVMKDEKGKYQSLHDINAKYTILYFWDPDCSHCKKVTPKLADYYAKVKQQGVEVFAVCTEVETDKWKKFIEEYKLSWINVHDPDFRVNFRKMYDIQTTPVVYVLDEEKKIIAKKIGVEQLEEIMDNFIKRDMTQKANE